METRAEKKGWLTDTRISLIALIGNIVFVIYIGAIQMNDTKNMVLKHEELLIKLETRVAQLDSDKLDKEQFTLFLTSIQDLKIDMRDLKNAIMEHIQKSKLK